MISLSFVYEIEVYLNSHNRIYQLIYKYDENNSQMYRN